VQTSDEACVHAQDIDYIPTIHKKPPD